MNIVVSHHKMHEQDHAAGRADLPMHMHLCDGQDRSCPFHHTTSPIIRACPSYRARTLANNLSQELLLTFDMVSITMSLTSVIGNEP